MLTTIPEMLEGRLREGFVRIRQLMVDSIPPLHLLSANDFSRR